MELSLFDTKLLNIMHVRDNNAGKELLQVQKCGIIVLSFWMP